MTTDFMSQAQAMRDELIARRRDFHQHPELAFQEVRTAGIVANELNRLGLEVTTGIGKTGVVAILEGDREGPTVLVRCDMDALPIIEANRADYISQESGKMHACGHDGHTAIGLAVAKMLTEQRSKIAGRVKFVFQPAEEIAQGAQAMINDGVLSDPVPQVSLGLHLWNDLPLGQVGITDGPAMAGSDFFRIVIRGSGGHAAMPAQTHDPIIAATQIVSALQTIVSRNINGLDTAVVSVTTFHAGDADNVIPAQAILTGTFRFYLPEVHDLIERRMREIITGIATAMQCEAEITSHQSAPPLVNDITSNARLRRAFGAINQPQPLTWKDQVRTMGAEDMAVFLKAIPGTFIFVGSANESRDLHYPHHHPRFDFDEAALPIGAGLLATAVADYVLID
ncbi:MAG: amidohydrolase [Chloroflexota bacterium]